MAERLCSRFELAIEWFCCDQFAVANAMMPNKEDRLGWWIIGGSGVAFLVFLTVIVQVVAPAGIDSFLVTVPAIDQSSLELPHCLVSS